jgi:hypothetical protein
MRGPGISDGLDIPIDGPNPEPGVGSDRIRTDAPVFCFDAFFFTRTSIQPRVSCGAGTHKKTLSAAVPPPIIGKFLF